MNVDSRMVWSLQRACTMNRYTTSMVTTKYGLTLEQFNQMYEEQGGQCAICSTKVEDSKICVDHNHNTGRVRRLLCHNCNVILGHAFEDPSILIKCAEYLNADF